MNSRCFHVVAVAVALALLPAMTHAEVKRIDVSSRTDVQNGSPTMTTKKLIRLINAVTALLLALAVWIAVAEFAPR